MMIETSEVFLSSTHRKLLIINLVEQLCHQNQIAFFLLSLYMNNLIAYTVKNLSNI